MIFSVYCPSCRAGRNIMTVSTKRQRRWTFGWLSKSTLLDKTMGLHRCGRQHCTCSEDLQKIQQLCKGCQNGRTVCCRNGLAMTQLRTRFKTQEQKTIRTGHTYQDAKLVIDCMRSLEGTCKESLPLQIGVWRLQRRRIGKSGD